MSTSRLIPYVEIIVDRKAQLRRRFSSIRSSSTSPTRNDEPNSPILSPRKKRKLRTTSTDSDDVIVVSRAPEKAIRPLSPTASDFEPPESETVANEMPSDEEEKSEDPARRSPSLGAAPIHGRYGRRISSNSKGKAIDRGDSKSPPSEFAFEPGSETVADEILSNEEESDDAARRSPSLGAFSNSGRISSELKGKAVDHGDATLYYEPETDEVVEDEDLPVKGETPPEDDDDEIPVRLLEDFTVYNSATMEIIPVAQLLMLEFSDTKYGASGLVKAWVDPDSEDDEVEEEDVDGADDSEDRIYLSHILEFCLHNALDGQKFLDAKIYIRTKYAWYILGCPSAVYNPYFAPFWTQHRLLHLLINSCLKNYRLTYEEFESSLQEIDTADESGPTSSLDILGRDLSEEDLKLDEALAYLLSSIPEICSANRIKISRVPAIREIMGSEHYEFDVDISQGSPKKGKKAGPKIASISSNIEKEVLKHRNKTFLTPVVNEIAKDFFHGSLEAIPDQEEDDDAVRIKLPHYKGHHTDPLKIVWGEGFPGGKVFKSANVDGIVYNVGDVVMVEPETKDETIIKASQTVNKYGNRWWFCQIRYFFDRMDKGKKIKMFHGVWFSHGSKTILQETAHSKSLYLLEMCDNIHVTAIFKKCNIEFVKAGYPEPQDNGSPDSNDFHCSYLYDEEHVAFVDIPKNVLDIEPVEEGYTCFSCDAKDELKRLEEIQLHSDKLVVHGVEYHVHDFVYIQPTNDSKLLGIGQITKLDSENFSITVLGRYDDYVAYQNAKDDDSELISDERKLFFTTKTKDIEPHRLDGICHVLHLSDSKRIEEWIKHDDHYYLDSKGSKEELEVISKTKFTYCKTCNKEDKEAIRLGTRLLANNAKLAGMELFCGAGGLGIGMDLSGFVETKYAVEFSPSAAKTYMKNHPDTTVYCQDTNNLLKHAITGLNSDGKRGPLMSKQNDRTACPPLPKKEDPVDFIFGGPPCQSFSHMNHSKRRDDIRSSLACNMLSYVEHYEPSYFLLENVAGFLDHKFYTKRLTESGEVDCVVSSGMVKFCLRTLIALGYQVRYKLLQAGQYGAPQSRKRVIIWGARRGVPLPQFPVPVYAFPQPAHKVSLPTGEKLNPPTRSKMPGECHSFAPLRPRTVNDALGDLPPFDWINPHEVIPESSRDRKEALRRLEEMEIPRFDAVSQHKGLTFKDLPGFPGGAQYPMPPQNRYQVWLRQGMGEDDLVMGQYTTRFGTRIVEATMNVPLRPLADHRDVPTKLLPKRAQPYAPKKQSPRIFYGRMDGDGHFKCAVTTLSPATKNQWPVHPNQKRIITVREAARSQGFPDHYVFMSNNTKPQQIVADQLRQIGNAVAVPFALALGKELGKVLVQTWEREEREGSVEA